MKLKNLRPFIRFARYLTIEPGSDYQPHIPLDARLFFVSDGYGKIQLNNKIYDMKKSSCLIIPQGTEYRLLTPEKSVTYLALNFDFNYKKNSPVTPVSPIAPKDYSDKLLINDIKITDAEILTAPLYIQSANIENELIQIELEYSRSAENHECITSNILHNILIKFARGNNSEYKYSVKLNAEKVLDYIHENFNTNISNSSIADIFGFNQNYISNVIKSYTGLPMHKYLLHIRIVKSLSYLETQKYTISETAQMCGFNDISYFSRYFKKEMGISPLKYLDSIS